MQAATFAAVELRIDLFSTVSSARTFQRGKRGSPQKGLLFSALVCVTRSQDVSFNSFEYLKNDYLLLQ